MEVLFGVWPGCLSITLHSLTSAGSSSIIVTPLFLLYRHMHNACTAIDLRDCACFLLLFFFCSVMSIFLLCDYYLYILIAKY